MGAGQAPESHGDDNDDYSIATIHDGGILVMPILDNANMHDMPEPKLS